MSRPDDDIPEVRPAGPRRRSTDNEFEYAGNAEMTDMGQDVGMRMLLPVGRSGWAIASGYLGLISVLLIPAPLALLTGALAILEIRKNPKKHGMGRAIFGIVMGTLFSAALVMVLVALLAAGGRR